MFCQKIPLGTTKFATFLVSKPVNTFTMLQIIQQIIKHFSDNMQIKISKEA